MKHVRPYEKLIVWQEAHKLCLFVYSTTKTLPADERFRLIDQMCRAGSSVPTNIAEGSVRNSKKERAHFYQIAAGSLEELHYHFVLARDLKYIDADIFLIADNSIQRISYLLSKLKLSLRL